MKTKLQLLIAFAAFLLAFLLVPPVYQVLADRLDRIDQDALNRRIAMLQATAVNSPAALQARYHSISLRTVPILPPDPDFALNPSGGIVVFDPQNFAGWLDCLEPAERDGVTVYPVTVAEDRETRATDFYNGLGEPIATLAAEQNYDPFAWLAERHPELYAENADPDLLAWAQSVYDPARVSVTFYLLPVESVEAMATAQLAAGQNIGMNMMMGEGLPEPVTNIWIFAIEHATNGTALGVGWPEGFTNKLEVFARTNIAVTGWFVASTNLSTAGTNSLWWVDTSVISNTASRFYRAGNADQDSDSDGLTDAREKMIYGSDGGVSDTDHDSLSDGDEILLGTSPLAADSDGDWISDYVETQMLASNPNDPNDPGAPQPGSVHEETFTWNDNLTYTNSGRITIPWGVRSVDVKISVSTADESFFCHNDVVSYKLEGDQGVIKERSYLIGALYDVFGGNSWTVYRTAISYTGLTTNSPGLDYTLTAHNPDTDVRASRISIDVTWPSVEKAIDVIPDAEKARIYETSNKRFYVKEGYTTNVSWALFPIRSDGARFMDQAVSGNSISAPSGSGVWVSPGKIPCTYVIRATVNGGGSDDYDESMFTVLNVETDPGGHAVQNTIDPLNPVSGACKIEEMDLNIPCPGLDLVLARYYNNRLSGVQCGLGEEAWTHSLNWRITDYTNMTYRGISATRWKVLSAGDDNLHWFPATTNGWSPPFDQNWTLTETTSGAELKMAGGSTGCRFDTNGFLVAMSNLYGQALCFSYEGTGYDRRLSRVEHNNGQYLAFSYSNGCLTQASTPVPSLYMTYTWDASSNLVAATRHTLEGASPISYLYGPDQASITQRVDRAGDVFSYEYAYTTDFAGQLVESKASGMHVGTNRYYETEIVYSGNGTNTVRYIVGGTKRAWSNLYDSATRQTTDQRTPGGTALGYDYDGNFNVTRLSSQSPDGSVLIISNRYGPSHLIFGTAQILESNAYETIFGWNTNTLLLKWVKDPMGARVDFDYANRLLSRYQVQGDNGETFDTLFYYDANGLMTAMTNANGNGVHMSYDSWGNLSRVETDLGPWVAYSNNRLGHVESILTKDGRTTTFDVNELGWVKGITWPDGLMDRFGFDPSGNVTSHVDRAGRLVRFDYLPTGKPASAVRNLNGTNVGVRTTYNQQFNTLNIEDELGRPVESYALDMDGRPVCVTNLEGQTMSLHYTSGERLAWMTRFDGTVVSNRYSENQYLKNVEMIYLDDEAFYGYSSNGLLKYARYSGINQFMNYDKANRLIWTRSTPDNCSVVFEVEYAHLPDGQVTNKSYEVICGYANPVNVGTTVLKYDGADRVKWIQNGPDRFSYAYSTNSGLLNSVTYTNAGVSLNYAYDCLDQATNLVWSYDSGKIFRSFSYALNEVGMITNLVMKNGDKTKYTYDDLNRLTGEEQRNASNQVLYSAIYGYDLAGNRARTVINGVTNDYTLRGDGNRYQTFGSGGHAKYDPAGCVTTLIYGVGQRLDFAWDGRYEMTTAKTNGGVCERHGYDALGRRVWTWTDAKTNWFAYDGQQVVGDLNATGKVLRSYVWGPGIDNMLSMTVCTGSTPVTYYPLKDHLGTIHAFVNDNGKVVESYSFDAWGRVLSVTDGSGDSLSESAIGNRYLWQGREYSWKTGLYYFRARWYDPVTGRWLSNDPIGISGGLNQYVFCGNDPVNNRDPFGLCEDSFGEKTLNWIKNDLFNLETIRLSWEFTRDSDYTTLSGWGEGTLGMVGLVASVADAGFNIIPGKGQVEGGIKSAIKTGITSLSEFQLKKLLNLGAKESIHTAKREILKDAGEAALKTVGTNPNIAIDKAGKVVLESTEREGVSTTTELLLDWYKK